MCALIGADLFLTASLWVSLEALAYPLHFSSSWEQWVIQHLFFLFLKVKVVETQE